MTRNPRGGFQFEDMMRRARPVLIVVFPYPLTINAKNGGKGVLPTRDLNGSAPRLRFHAPFVRSKLFGVNPVFSVDG